MASTYFNNGACFFVRDDGVGEFLLLPEDDDARVRAMQALLKGYFEPVHTTKEVPFVAYINEEGRDKKMLPNELGTNFLRHLGFSPYITVLGPILIVPVSEELFTDAERQLIMNAMKMRKEGHS